MSEKFGSQELSIFESVTRLRSVRKASRELNVSPSQVSKSLKEFEAKLGQTLVHRSPLGIEATPQGLRVLEDVEMILERFRKLEKNALVPDKKVAPPLTFASLSFLSSRLIPRILEQKNFKDYSLASNIRVVEFSHNELVSSGLKGYFDVAIHIEKLAWPKTWVSIPIAPLEWNVFVAHKHPLKAKCTRDQLKNYPFVVPTGWNGKRFVIGNDLCPISWNDRVKGHEATTAEVALEIVARSNQLVHAPRIAGEALIHQKALRILKVEEFPSVKRTVYLSVLSEKVSVAQLRFLVKSLKNILDPFS